MKNILPRLLLALFASSALLQAQLSIPSDGSDGALNITANTVIDLSQAVTGTWDANNSANAGKGIFDPAKRAIVFKYSSVNINASRTVTFTNHPSRAPVVWLVQGTVAIAGTLSLNGSPLHSTICSQSLAPEAFGEVPMVLQELVLAWVSAVVSIFR
jgi:plastocyanin